MYDLFIQKFEKLTTEKNMEKGSLTKAAKRNVILKDRLANFECMVYSPNSLDA